MISRRLDSAVSGAEKDKAEAFIREIRAMNARMEIPTGFDFIKDKDIPQMITWALKEANPTYPVPATAIFRSSKLRISLTLFSTRIPIY